jgi:tyrosinase
VDQTHLFGAFAIWHALLTYEFEIAIRSINPNVSIPYWDWTLDEATGSPADSVLFTDAYFGAANASNDYIVDNGYVANFPVTKDYKKYVE